MSDRTILTRVALANAVPLIGVVALGWNLGHMFFLYWIETLLIGVFMIVRIFAFRFDFVSAQLQHHQNNLLKTVATALFFCIHYFGFTYGPVAFVSFMGVQNPLLNPPVPVWILASEVAAVSVAQLLAIRSETKATMTDKKRSSVLLVKPYLRIFVTYGTLLFGALPAIFLVIQDVPVIAVGLGLFLTKTSLETFALHKLDL